MSRARDVFVRSVTPVRLYSSIMVSALCEGSVEVDALDERVDF